MTDNLRIVLFGGPAAGKTSLIGALVQAAKGQNALLGGQFHDVGGAMTELANQTYQKGPAPTQDELRDYPFAVEPAAPGTGTTMTATLTDCSGAAAEAILASQGGLPVDQPLAKALLEADALILVIDAGAVERSVPLMGQFLQLLQRVRGERADIGGLPVHLVLSKCDSIARPTDTNSQWFQRIEEGKRKLGERFEQMLKDQAGLPFGRVNLQLSATAVKRPALADRAAKADPYGVAELFRESLASAQSHHQQREHAAGRLSLAVAGMFGLVAAMLLLSSAFLLLRPSAELSALEDRVHRVLPGSRAADRLREPLDERFKELALIQKHPQFDWLAPAMRSEVEQASAEIEQYQQFYKAFQEQVTDPRLATRDDELDRIEKSLAAFALPESYLAAWQDTKLVRRLQHWRGDIQLLRAASKEEIDWMQRQTAASQKLREQGGLVLAKTIPLAEREAWFAHVQDYLDREPSHKRSDRLAPTSTLTYDHVYRLQRVEQARKAWDSAKNSLQGLRKLAQQ